MLNPTENTVAGVPIAVDWRKW